MARTHSAARLNDVSCHHLRRVSGYQRRAVARRSGDGHFCTLLALADPEQRIYRLYWRRSRTAEPLPRAFAPAEVDLSTDHNYRSPGTEIVMFGNDLLTGNFRQQDLITVSTSGIRVKCRSGHDYPGHDHLSRPVTRLVKSGHKEWSLAILVPTKKMTPPCVGRLQVSPGGMTEIPAHVAAIDTGRGDPRRRDHCTAHPTWMRTGTVSTVLSTCCAITFHGRGGDTPAKGDLAGAANFRNALRMEWYVRRRLERELGKTAF